MQPLVLSSDGLGRRAPLIHGADLLEGRLDHPSWQTLHSREKIQLWSTTEILVKFAQEKGEPQVLRNF